MGLLFEPRTKTRTLVNAANGVLYVRGGEMDGKVVEGGISGTLVGIFYREWTDSFGKKHPYYDFNIDDGDEAIRLSVGESVAKSMLFSLITVENISGNKLVITTSQGGQINKERWYTNVFIKCNGVDLRWATDRKEWPEGVALSMELQRCMTTINARLHGGMTENSHEAPAPEAAPEQGQQAPAQKPVVAAPASPAAPANAAAPAQAAPTSANDPYYEPAPFESIVDDMPNHI